MAIKHFWRFYPYQHSFSRVFRQFELNRSLGFALDHRNTFTDAIVFDKIGHSEFDQIAAA